MTNRYIKTKVDDKTVLLYMTKCNFCPYMITNTAKREVLCKKKLSLVGNKRIKSINAYTWIKKSCYPLVDVSIPDWCPLETKLISAVSDPLVVYVKDGDLVSNIGVTESLNIVGDLNIKHDGYNLVNTNKPISMLPTTYHNGTNTELTYGYGDSLNAKTIAIPIRQKCSLCGEKKESVNRDTNLGTCDECWELCESDENKKHVAFINNFRMVRNAPFSNKNYKNII